VNRRPRGAVAFKFASPAKVTTVVDIQWDTGPSGRVTPVAIVAPVELAGAKVQRASLHNAANVRELGIGVGDEVLVSRRNDVIPYVEEVVEKKGAVAEPPRQRPVRRGLSRRAVHDCWPALPAHTPALRSRDARVGPR